MLRVHWVAIQKMADDAVWPVDRLEPFFSFLLSMADICLDSVEELRQGLDEAGDGAIDGSALSDVADSVRSLRAEVSAVWSFLTAPIAKRTLRTTAEIREGRARGEYQEPGRGRHPGNRQHLRGPLMGWRTEIREPVRRELNALRATGRRSTAELLNRECAPRDGTVTQGTPTRTRAGKMECPY